MIFDSAVSSLFILLFLSQLVFLISQILAKRADDKHYTWKSTLRSILRHLFIVAILYFIVIAILNVTVGDNTNSDLIMSYILCVSITLILAVDLIFDPFKVNKSFWSKDDKLYPPKSVAKKGEFLHPPKSINRMAEE